MIFSHFYFHWEAPKIKLLTSCTSFNVLLLGVDLGQINSGLEWEMPTNSNPDIVIDSSVLLDRFAMSVIRLFDRASRSLRLDRVILDRFKQYLLLERININ